MLEELERRNDSASTTRAYLRAVYEFPRYFKRSPDQLGPDHIRQLSEVSVPRKEATPQHSDPASRWNPFLLHQDVAGVAIQGQTAKCGHALNFRALAFNPPGSTTMGHLVQREDWVRTGGLRFWRNLEL